MAAFTLTSASHILRTTTLRCSSQRGFSLWSSALLRSTRCNACQTLNGNVLQRRLPSAVSTPSRSISTPSKILQFVRTDAWRATHRSSYGRAPPPPRRRAPFSVRALIDSLPSGLFLWGILALNGGILLLWGYAHGMAREHRDFSWLKWMHDNFLVSMRNVQEGRLWTVLTCCFSHQEIVHFAVNAMTYYFMAPAVIAMLGNTSFLALYLGGGIISSCLSLFVGQQIRHRDVPSQGASGAIYSVISFFACVAPRAELLIFGIVPCQAWIVVGGLFLYDGWLSINGGGGKIDNAGHVGGMLAGVGYYALKRMGMRI
ncbi:rhomboid-domain-containing protein [Neolentinus lepideus HHB14362 ss-1]|uniref:Rhomboid-domain-containing protein n=1 Tax=Neolentinus lepideus HHB14362 ss-1 TaxID=1314782 RepID=A0A165TNG2_9AGAM|nr:rhomboid-domain-containing protein [Neolentinus lepideus HHB14362 ss-1]